MFTGLSDTTLRYIPGMEISLIFVCERKVPWCNG